jgi:glycosyltransferase involved in cell wall biosynthesis
MIVQPYVPSYRVPLFERMSLDLAERGCELLVVAGSPGQSNSLRKDSAVAANWLKIVGQRSFSCASRRILWRKIGPELRAFNPDYIIIEQAIGNLDGLEVLLKFYLRRRFHLAMWGHGRTYTESRGKFHAAIKTWFTKRMSWFFSYTDGGASYLADHGYPADKITVLHNSIDSTLLKANLKSLDSQEIKNFRERNQIDPRVTALFLGGLDERKGIHFLLAAAELAGRRIPGFTLAFGGEGALSDELRQMQLAGAPIRVLGRLEGQAKALALSSCRLLAIPEWVGLVAVDSFAAGVPIVTTTWPYHAPEFEYLQNEKNAIITEHLVNSFCDGMVDLITDDSLHSRLAQQALSDGQELNIERFSHRFVSGIEKWSVSSSRS